MNATRYQTELRAGLAKAIAKLAKLEGFVLYTFNIDRADASGAPLVVIRMSTPGGLDSAMRQIIDRMLANMFGTSGDGLSDRLLHFVTPVGGGYFFVPSEPLLQRLAT